MMRWTNLLTCRTLRLLPVSKQLGALMASKSAYINEHEKLLTKKERLLKDLKGTREQKRRSEDAKTNFSSWLRQLDDEEFRKREEESMEINRRQLTKR